MDKKMTIDKLAGMTQRGFSDLGRKIDGGFKKNEEEHTEIVAVLREMIVDLKKIRSDVQETKEMVKDLTKNRNLEERIAKLERKVGV